jgi:ABC-type bacteriocin/lantibiotic exporter with double-glycine peptidase domain
VSRAVVLAVALVAAGCTGYTGAARSFSPQRLSTEPGWLALRGVPFERQVEEADCGAAAIAMVIAYWTGRAPRAIAAALRPAPEKGIEAGRLRDLAHRRGLAAFIVRGQLADLERELAAGRPVLVGLVKPHGPKRVLTHYEVVVGLHKGRKLIVTLDPASGWRENSLEAFLDEWAPSKRLALVVSARVAALHRHTITP